MKIEIVYVLQLFQVASYHEVLTMNNQINLGQLALEYNVIGPMLECLLAHTTIVTLLGHEGPRCRCPCFCRFQVLLSWSEDLFHYTNTVGHICWGSWGEILQPLAL